MATVDDYLDKAPWWRYCLIGALLSGGILCSGVCWQQARSGAPTDYVLARCACAPAGELLFVPTRNSALRCPRCGRLVEAPR